MSRMATTQLHSCESCGLEFEVTQSIAAPPAHCYVCGQQARRLIGQDFGGFFNNSKAGGWYGKKPYFAPKSSK